MKRANILKSLFAAAGMLLVANSSYAQDDFGLDLNVGAEKKICNGLSLGVDAGMRTQDNTRRMERYELGAELDYKFVNTKTFDMKAAVGYKYMWQHALGETVDKRSFAGDVDENGNFPRNVMSSYWRNRQRTTLGVGASYKPNKRWSFSLKETVQYNHYNAVDSIGRTKWRFNDDDELYSREDPASKSAKDRFVLRSRLLVQYNIKHSPLAPYAFCDYGRGLNYNVNKWKIGAGTDIKLSKKDKLDIYYQFVTENDDDEQNGHLIGVSYKYNF